MDHKQSALFLEMGLGKTIITLTAISNLILLGDVSRVLIIAPKKVAESTWSAEISKWEHTKDLRVSKILGTPKQRINAINEDADTYIINRENIPWLVTNCFKCWKWDMCVIDELSSFKSNKAQRFKSLKKVRPYFKWIVGLTGTPAPNTLIELWSQIYLLDGGQRLGKTLTSYRDAYFTPGDRNGMIIYNYNLRPGAEEAIYKKIDDICISMKSKDYLKLPDRVDNKILVNLPKEARKTYDDFVRDLIIQLEDEDITAANSAVLTGKLLQICNGAIYADDTKEVIEVHEEKLNALLNIIEEANGKPILVFYNFKHDISRIQEFLKRNKIESRELKNNDDIENWNKGNIRVMLTHPASAAYGLNIQQGGNIIVWFGLTWSLELYQQACARLYRQGQKETVIINHIIAKGTVDEDVIKALQGKEINQNLLLEAVKARMKS